MYVCANFFLFLVLFCQYVSKQNTLSGVCLCLCLCLRARALARARVRVRCVYYVHIC